MPGEKGAGRKAAGVREGGPNRSAQGRGHWSALPPRVLPRRSQGMPGVKGAGKKATGVREGGPNRSAQGRGHWSAHLPPRRVTKHGHMRPGPQGDRLRGKAACDTPEKRMEVAKGGTWEGSPLSGILCASRLEGVEAML